jgi:hypothetical protein
MKERGILFSAPMVRALLAGTKTQKRRIVKLPRGGEVDGFAPDDFAVCWSRQHQPTGDEMLRSPYGVPGDRLWVRETWTHDADSLEAARADHEDAMGPGAAIYYRATMSADEAGTFPRWRSPISMPRWASRITLEVTDVRVERVHDISEADILAEGCAVNRVAEFTGTPWSDMPTLHSAWERAWTHINGADSWAANPWVWVVEFKRVP